MEDGNRIAGDEPYLFYAIICVVIFRITGYNKNVIAIHIDINKSVINVHTNFNKSVIISHKTLIKV